MTTNNSRGEPRRHTAAAPPTRPGIDPAYLEQLYEEWKNDPTSLDPSWQLFFQGFDLASCPRSCTAAVQAQAQSRVASLIYNYRDQGFRVARTNPLERPPADLDDLSPASYGFTSDDMDRVFDTGHLGGPQRATLREIIRLLQETYCGHISVEYLHIHEVEIRRWLQARMEPNRNQPSMERRKRLEILRQLVDAELFETFIQRHYLGQKRFSLEGAETLIPMLHSVIERAPELNIAEIVLGMSHRGRLNVLANLLDKSYALIFSEFEDNFIEGSVGGGGDVKYHKGFSSEHINQLGRSVRLDLAANPSHLEAVDPVVLGMARARQRQIGDADRRKSVLPLLVHGDAAFSGQGIVAETFNLSRLDGYQVGGTLHVVVNNQIGFTTLPGQARSSQNVTDVGKMVGAPIFHVNGDDPEASVHAIDLALQFRQEFGRDVVVELMCYRRHGHSEGDEPAFTQPRLYREIRRHAPVRRMYTDRLLASGDLSADEERDITEKLQGQLDEAFQFAREKKTGSAASRVAVSAGDSATPPPGTGVAHDRLREVMSGLCRAPDGFHLNPKITRQLPRRLSAVEQMGDVDWSTAEALALGTLLTDGIPVRLSGQDSERGTFSQRHSVWRDVETDLAHVPLNHIRASQAKFCVYNSPLSEASVLGFDYGYSLAEPKMLIMWEAQFGDFANGAQVIIDQFIVAAQAKWNRSSALVMLLPHGFEGQGPEHSNAYLERYLAACAGDNIQVCYPSTPAQYFHVLRRQAMNPHRRPLIMMTPKSLLRLPAAVSPVTDLIEGRFSEILADPAPPKKKPRRLVLSSGKIYYDLAAAREKNSVDDVALLRVEQLYPFPTQAIAEAAATCLDAEIIWAQEEPRNRGAWTFIEPRLRALLEGRPPRYVGRPASASPAAGSLRRHRLEQARVVAQALGLAEDDSSRGEAA